MRCRSAEAQRDSAAELPAIDLAYRSPVAGPRREVPRVPPVSVVSSEPAHELCDEGSGGEGGIDKLIEDKLLDVNLE